MIGEQLHRPLLGLAQQVFASLGRLERVVRWEIEARPQVDYRRVQPFCQRAQAINPNLRATDGIGQNHRPSTF